MDGHISDVIANRDEPIPVIGLPSQEDEDLSASSSDPEQNAGKREEIKTKVGDVKDKLSSELGLAASKPSIQERFFHGVMSQILSVQDISDEEDDSLESTAKEKKKDRRGRKYVDRPGFSIPLMSSNFRRFNARVGILFVLQNQMIHLFTWKHHTATLSYLAIYTLLCLKPELLPAVALGGMLFWIMVPSFLARHPTPANDPRVEPSYRGPPNAPPSQVKPAPEMSKDFFRNMRDLQNSMEDFSRLHDAANEYISPYTNFSDEALSSLLFVWLFALTCLAFISSELVPFKSIALLVGWAVTWSGHPEAQKVLLSTSSMSQARHSLNSLRAWLKSTVETDILLDDPPETRQVEIFELQKYHPDSNSWEAWLFSPTPFDPLSSPRVSGQRPRGTQFFEDVQPPTGWSWKDKKWNLDLWSREWIEQRMITGVEVEVEGERWVYDLPDDVVEKIGVESPKGRAKKGIVKNGRDMPTSGWEEGTGTERRGEWRRRRWVRMVERNGRWKAGDPKLG
ncbi:hypothetical protein M433DRAFT_3241 [Acidomyces richmondensis BFW]|nr:hypothetical protein M433DRAFT_3241 [Acidomyces richmondensis BFW]